MRRSSTKRRTQSRRAVLDQLERDALLELAIGALAEDTRDPCRRGRSRARCETGRSDRATGPASAAAASRSGAAICDGRRFEKAVGAVIRAQQLEHFVAQRGIVGARAFDERRLLFVGEIDRRIENGIDAAKPIGR